MEASAETASQSGIYSEFAFKHSFRAEILITPIVMVGLQEAVQAEVVEVVRTWRWWRTRTSACASANRLSWTRYVHALFLMLLIHFVE
jgi:hypothetical protein